MFACTGRFGVFYLTKNAEKRHTRIHTYTHTVCFLVSRPQAVFHASLNLGKSTRTQGKECTFRNFRRPQNMGRGDPRWAQNPVLATPHARKYTPTLKTLVFKLKIRKFTFKMRFQASLDLQKTLKSSENDKNVCVFGCLCVFFTCVYGENAIHANT